MVIIKCISFLFKFQLISDLMEIFSKHALKLYCKCFENNILALTRSKMVQKNSSFAYMAFLCAFDRYRERMIIFQHTFWFFRNILVQVLEFYYFAFIFFGLRQVFNFQPQVVVRKQKDINILEGIKYEAIWGNLWKLIMKFCTANL